MKHTFTETNYSIPYELIAHEPSKKRGADRLFVFNTHTNEITHDTFQNIATYLQAHTLCVLNRTSVIPARIKLKKETGGALMALFLVNEKTKRGTVRIMVDRKVEVGTKLCTLESQLIGEVILHSEKSIFNLRLNVSKTQVLKILEEKGIVPLPLYIKQTTLSSMEQKIRYQTTFAHKQSTGASVAAPTAGLHFTKEVLTTLKNKEIDTQYITLHIGLGTFAPLTNEQITQKKLHKEWYSILNHTADALRSAKSLKRDILAVGTTTMRTLESFSMYNTTVGDTELFIQPPHMFYYPTMLLTNFHLPGTSLMLLVQAFLQYKKSKRNLIQLYNEAIQKKYHFYSFGDAMLII